MNRSRHLSAILAALLLSAARGAPAQDFAVPATGDFLGIPAPFDAAQPPSGDPVAIRARFGADAAGRGVLEITAKVADSYHIYSTTQPPGGPGATKITVDASPDYAVAGAFEPSTPPESHVDNEVWEGLVVEEHTGTVTWRAPVSFAGSAESTTIRGSVNLQACQEFSCLPLVFDFAATLDASVDVGNGEAVVAADDAGVGADGAPTPPTDPVTPLGGSLAAVLGAALLGGLILNLMPCVLPVIGLKVLSFAEQAGNDRARVLAMNLAYSAGLLSIFLVLATLAASLGYAWGELYTFPTFKIGLVVLVFAMALSFLGVWEIPIPGFAGAGAANDLQAKEGLSGAFFKGVFTTILATPCSGPFLGEVFAFTAGQPPATVYLVFLCVGLGMASPYLLTGAFPGLVRFLPKPGAWMETFKQVMGFVLMATVVYLLSLVAADQRLAVLTLLVGVGIACWWIGRTPLTASPSTRSTAWVGGAVTAAAIGYAGFFVTAPSKHELPWQPYSPIALADAKASGETVLVDFTASWCPTCKLNLKRAINTEGVREVVEANRVRPLLADWSDRSETIKQALAELDSQSIPLLAIYPANRPDNPIVLRDLISEEQLLDALRAAGAVIGNGEDFAMPTIEIGDATPEPSLR